MKKLKLCLIPIASLLLSGCSWAEFKSDTWVGRTIVSPVAGWFGDKEEENEEQKDEQKEEEQQEEQKQDEDALTPAQKANAEKTVDLIYNFVKEDFTVEIADQTKEYIVSNSEHIAKKGVDATKVEGYIASISETDFEDALGVLSLVMSIKMDNGVFDLVYFGTALGKCYLKAGEVSDETNAEKFAFLLKTVEDEGDNLPDNAVAVIDKVLGVAISDVMPLISSTEIMGLISSITAFEPLNPDHVKAAFKDVNDLIEKLLPIKENAMYLAEFAKKIAYGFPLFFEGVPEAIAPVLDALEVGKLVGALFDLADAFGDKISSLSAAYYTHLGEIEDPVESYAYTVLGALEEMIPEVVIDGKELNFIPSAIIEVLNELVKTFSEEIGEYKKDVLAIINNANTKALLEAFFSYVVDLTNVKYESITAARISYLIGYVFNALSHEMEEPRSYDFDDIDVLSSSAEIPYLVLDAMDSALTDARNALAFNQGYEGTGDGRVISGVEENDGVVRVKVTAYDYIVMVGYGDGNVEEDIKMDDSEEERPVSFHGTVQYTNIYISISALDDLYVFVKEILHANTKKAFTDVFVDHAAKIITPLISLFDTYALPILSSSDDEDAKTAIDVFSSLELIFGNSEHINKENVELIQKAVNDAFVAIDTLFEIFVPHGEEPALVNFTLVAAYFASNPLAGVMSLMQKVPEENLLPLKEVLKDAYNIVALFDGATESMINAINDSMIGSMLSAMEIDITAVTNAVEFSDAMFALVEYIFKVPEAVEA